MISIYAEAFAAAGKLLKRLRFNRAKLPEFEHLAVYADGDFVTLAVATLNQRLETRIPLAEPIARPESFLIPPDALRTALKADKGSIITLAGKGARRSRMVRLKVACGAISVETHHPTLDIDSFPDRPDVDGTSCVIPGRTMEMLAVVASCASTNQTRHILNGVHLTPQDGGMLVATDGKRLAGAPATVPSTEGGFILPNDAVHVLTHPEFGSGVLTVTLSEDGETTGHGGGDGDGDEKDRLVCFQSENHLLITRTITGNYPNWKQVVPQEMVASLTIAEDRRAAVVTWLRSLRGQDGSVTLSRKKRGVLLLTHTVSHGIAATVAVPVTETGTLPPVTLDPALLATALEIAPTLWLTDSCNPVVARRPDGVFCVVMPMRLAGNGAGGGADANESSDQTKTPVPTPDQAAA